MAPKRDITDQYIKLMAGEAKSRGKGERRPYMSSDCKNLQDAEMYRMQIMHEIKSKVTDIQNASLGEFKIRELNDEINKLVRERGHWQRRIKELGGPDHSLSSDSKDDGGVRPRGSGGYAYYGASKNLPGVRELFEVEAQGPAKRSRTELYKAITPDYYGFRDEDDGVLQRVEKRAEQKSRSRHIIEDRKKRKEDVQFIHDLEDTSAEASMSVPSQAEVERRLLALKKRQLLERYGIKELSATDDTAAKYDAEDDAPTVQGPATAAPAPAPQVAS
eukprot:TRINITY_DN2516_c0_g2_i1.p1 TRINITY_DN2516_c0_g2~~TRINITY_DN2516_c0_g2_i1.p1  ORF type:complete len:295 (+),score=108.97 TRINITY_DN2516_c0_g2_i1:61-885(+)